MLDHPSRHLPPLQGPYSKKGTWTGLGDCGISLVALSESGTRIHACTRVFCTHYTGGLT
jgi:hypothetical protein